MRRNAFSSCSWQRSGLSAVALLCLLLVFCTGVCPAQIRLQGPVDERPGDSSAVVSFHDQLAQKLVRSSSLYQRIHLDGGWESISAGTIRSEELGNFQIELRKRLCREHYPTCDLLDPLDALDPPDPPEGIPQGLSDSTAYNTSGTPFDSTLFEAVQSFQRIHGLIPDGIVGPRTLSALNVSAQDRARQLSCTAQSVRSQADSADTEVIVNIPAFRLWLIQDGKAVLSSRVIVGTVEKQTPEFSTELNSVTIAPYWHVPNSIAVEEILPNLKRNANYATRQHMTVYRESYIVNPDSIAWEDFSSSNFPFRVRQDPGPWNQLGRMKFGIPNAMGIGLHGTPTEDLFERTHRSLSHGCVRLEAPERLASALVSRDSVWTSERINDAADRFVPATLQIEQPVSFSTVYWTAWIDDESYVRFSRDMYDTDICSRE